MLTYAHSGAAPLQGLLASHPTLTCTSGTGVIPLCASALGTWQRVEQRHVAASSLAEASVRTLATTMITAILASGGGTRWCELATVPTNSALVFADLFPQAQFICLHRACDAVIRTATTASRWRLVGGNLVEYEASYHGNHVAASAAWWCDNTEALFAFETANSDRCMRLRLEELEVDAELVASSVFGFLKLGCEDRQQAGAPFPKLRSASGVGECDTAQIPVELMPAQMLRRVNGLHQELGYLPIMDEPSTHLANALSGQ